MESMRFYLYCLFMDKYLFFLKKKTLHTFSFYIKASSISVLWVMEIHKLTFKNKSLIFPGFI